MFKNIHTYKEWGSKVFEQEKSSLGNIINITINAAFAKLQNNVPATLNDGDSDYLFGSMSGEAALHKQDGGTLSYVAFAQGEAIAVKHGNNVTVFGKDAGKLTQSGENWSGAPTGKLRYMTILHTIGDANSGTGPSIRVVDGPTKNAFTRGLADNGSFIGSLLLKDMLGSSKLSTFKGSNKKIAELMPVIMNALKLANRSGIISTVPKSHKVLTDAGVSQPTTYRIPKQA